MLRVCVMLLVWSCGISAHQYIYWLGKAEEVYVKLKKMIAEGGHQEKPSLYLDGQLLEFLCCQGDLAHEVLGDHVLVEHILHKKTDRSAVNSITHTSDHHDAGCYHRHAAPKEVNDHQEHITTITGVISSLQGVVRDSCSWRYLYPRIRQDPSSVPLVTLSTLYLLACYVRVTTGESSLCCCACVMSFKC